MHAIGIMQGRLSLPYGNKIQSFPWNNWEQEFLHARDIGYSHIDWIVETVRLNENPLMTAHGRNRLKTLMQESGVGIMYVCGDYFMEQPFIRTDVISLKHLSKMLADVVVYSAAIGARGIELPFVDDARIDTDAEMVQVANELRLLVPKLEKYNVELLIESSLPPKKLKDFMVLLNHPLFGITYDTGNSASLGYSTEEEIDHVGNWIRNVHIKDRLRGGATVALGSGDAMFDKTFTALKNKSYKGNFTLQAARIAEPFVDAREQLRFVYKHINTYLH